MNPSGQGSPVFDDILDFRSGAALRITHMLAMYVYANTESTRPPGGERATVSPMACATSCSISGLKRVDLWRCHKMESGERIHAYPELSSRTNVPNAERPT